jgi:hypothetical protein
MALSVTQVMTKPVQGRPQNQQQLRTSSVKSSMPDVVSQCIARCHTAAGASRGERGIGADRLATSAAGVTSRASRHDEWSQGHLEPPGHARARHGAVVEHRRSGVGRSTAADPRAEAQADEGGTALGTTLRAMPRGAAARDLRARARGKAVPSEVERPDGGRSALHRLESDAARQTRKPQAR